MERVGVAAVVVRLVDDDAVLDDEETTRRARRRSWSALALASLAELRPCTSGDSTSHSPSPGPKRCVPRWKYDERCDQR